MIAITDFSPNPIQRYVKGRCVYFRETARSTFQLPLACGFNCKNRSKPLEINYAGARFEKH
jgi:hypothetical protein